MLSFFPSARLGRNLGAAVSNMGQRVLRPESMVRAGETPYDVVHDDGLVRLRHYGRQGNARQGTAPARYPVPLVIVPPLAINMLIYDWFPDRSLVKFLLLQGFEVYLIDWGRPRRRHAHYTLHTYVTELMPQLLDRVRGHSGRHTLSLHGWSMGGGLALCYQAWSGDTGIRNIVTVGTAVDGHANGQIGRQYAAANRVLQALRLDLRKLPPALAYAPGWVNTIAFKLSDPLGSARGYLDLLRHLDDRDFVSRHATQGAFMDHLEAYPGGVIRDWMYSIWLENEAARGYFSLGEGRVYLRDVSANLLALAGDRDTLANVHCCRPIMELVGSEDKTFRVCQGGHTGILSGSQAPGEAWRITAQWLAERSEA
mgnify:CR=1 FL=1